MGGLARNRKRVDSPSPLINSSNHHYYYYSCINQIDPPIAKKPRISYSQSPGKAIASPHTAVSRLSKYPEPEKLRREVHAPCRLNRIGFLSSAVKRKYVGVRENMGNAFRRAYDKYEQAKHDAFCSLQFFKVNKDAEVIVLDAEPPKQDDISKNWDKVEVVGDGNEVKSGVCDDHRVVDSGGTELRGKAVRNDANEETLATSDMMKGVDAAQIMGLKSLDRGAYEELLNTVHRKYIPKLSHLEFQIKTHEALRQNLQLSHKPKEKKKQGELKKPGEDLLWEPFVPLTEEEEREIKRAFSNSNRRKILVTHENSNIEITGEMLQCLRPGAWLNDEVINVYLELLKERERREPKKYLNCHFFNTFFYKKLIGGKNGYDYKAVRRWTSQRKLGYGLVDCDKIFVPIHREVHWCLAVINKKNKSLQYLDSLGGRDIQVLNVLARYFADEVKDKSGQEIDVESWEVEFVEDLPEQQNGFDCGVFMIKYADFYSRGLGLQFSQENMPYFRLRTAKEILRLRAD